MIPKPSIYWYQFEYIIFKEFLKMRAKNQKWLKKSSMTPDFSKYWYVKCNYKYMRIILRKIFTQNITSWALKWKGVLNHQWFFWSMITPDWNDHISVQRRAGDLGPPRPEKFNLSTFCVKVPCPLFDLIFACPNVLFMACLS